ncbi:hypothetical protein DH09_10135 [Bacillaceae bacterium JMAK1]|nr:hypothetical protein DH09_10135 [Bacillaceae bacterium JMAK1]
MIREDQDMNEEKRKELALRGSKGLVLKRKLGTSFIINDDIKITISEFREDKVKVIIDAPNEAKILRTELIIDEADTTSNLR